MASSSRLKLKRPSSSRLQAKCLGHLVASDHPAHPFSDPLGALQPPPLAPRRGRDGLKLLLGGIEQRLALARAFLGQQRGSGTP